MSIFNVEITLENIRNLLSRHNQDERLIENIRVSREAERSREEQRIKDEMDNNQFWVSFWRIVFGTTLLIIMTIAGCNSYETYLDKKEVEFFLNHGYKKAQIPVQFRDSWVKDETK